MKTRLYNILKVLMGQLQVYTSYHPDLPPLLHRLQSAQIELQDISGDLERISSHINYDPQKTEQLHERLSAGYKLQKKHGVHSTNELIEIQKQLEEKLQAVLNIDEAIRQKEKDLVKMNQEASQMAQKISVNRHKQVKPLEDKVNQLLARVGMLNAKLKVDIRQEDLHIFGTDHIEFYLMPIKAAGFNRCAK